MVLAGTVRAQITPSQSGSSNIQKNVALDPVMEELSERIQELEGTVKKLDKPSKDIWDKISAVSGLVTGGVVTILTILLTQWFSKKQREAQTVENQREQLKQDAENERQRKSDETHSAQQLAVVRAQTVEGFMPYLTSGDSASIKAALLAIESLGNPELTTKLGVLFGGPGSLDALFRVSQERPPELKDDATAAIGKIVQSYRSSVVQLLKDEHLSATGFFIDSLGTVLTAAHVAQRMGAEFTVRLSDSTVYTSQVVYLDRERDLALLRIADLESQPLNVNPVKSPPLLDQVAVIANSQDLAWTVGVGTVKSTATDAPPSKGQFAIDMESMPGFSGAPVIDRSGQVVGMLVGYSPRTKTTFVIPGDTIAKAIPQVTGRADDGN